MESAGKRKRTANTRYAGPEWVAASAAAKEHASGAEPAHRASDDGEQQDDGGSVSEPETPPAPRPKKQQKKAPAAKARQTKKAAAATAAAAPAPPATPAAPRAPPPSAQQRRQAKLVAALAERGLQLRGDSRLSEQYINSGRGDLADIVDTMDQMRFYFAHTQYEAYREKVFQEEMRYRGRCYPEEVSDDAKVLALEAWASRFRSAQEAAAAPELPASLVSRVQLLRWPLRARSTVPDIPDEPSDDDDWRGYGRW